MKRIAITPRTNFQAKIKKSGFNFADEYWLENAYYSFTQAEIDRLYDATTECYKMFIDAVQYVIDNDLWDKLHIPRYIVKTLKESWDSDELSLYGRFDFAMVGGVPKLLEFNADTPTSLFEASVAQWDWKEELFPGLDQFNSIHEALVESFKTIDESYESPLYNFTCQMENVEDCTTTAYIQSCAQEAGLSTSLMDISDVVERGGKFYDMNGNHLDVLFKLYPYEWMFNEDFGPAMVKCETTFIEPLWKAIMSNKYILVLVSKLFSTSPYVLRCEEVPLLSGNYCKKPIFSREGANVTLYKDGIVDCKSGGEYGEEGYVHQALAEIEPHDGMYPVIGSWVIGGESCGIGIRETKTKITDNMSNFVPHVIE